jgi:hypothetical protein
MVFSSMHHYSTVLQCQSPATGDDEEKDPSDGKASTSGLRPRSLTILIGLGS